MAVAATLIGLANWVRYAGVAFLPILGFSVLVASGAVFGKRILHATGAMLLGIALAFPCGSVTGNWPETFPGLPVVGRRVMIVGSVDAAKIIDLFEHSLFGFNYMLLANLKIPLILAVIFVAIGVFADMAFSGYAALQSGYRSFGLWDTCSSFFTQE